MPKTIALLPGELVYIIPTRLRYCGLVQETAPLPWVSSKSLVDPRTPPQHTVESVAEPIGARERHVAGRAKPGPAGGEQLPLREQIPITLGHLSDVLVYPECLFSPLLPSFFFEGVITFFSPITQEKH